MNTRKNTPNAQNDAQTRRCRCGTEYIPTMRWQRSCPACIEARAAEAAARPPKMCVRCGKEFEYVPGSMRRICPDCYEAEHEGWRARYYSTDLDRRREPVEVYVELCMEKYGPGSDSLTPRQHLALDRKIAAKRKKLLAGEHPVHNEFKMLVLVTAYRRGILTPEWWGRMRRMYFYSDAWCDELRSIYKALTGAPLKERDTFDHRGAMSSRDLEPVLPMLRRMADDPGHQPVEGEPQPPPPARPAEPESARPERDSWDDLTDVLLLCLYIEMEPDRRAKMRQLWREKGRYELLELTGHPVQGMEPEPVDLEWVDCANQDEVDAAAAALLDEISM